MTTKTTSSRGGSVGSVFRRGGSEQPAPAVVVLPAIAGLNAYIDRTSEALAAQGYASVSVDYYARTGAPDLSDRARIMAAVAALSDVDVLSDVAQNIEFLRSQPGIDAKRISVLGFCIGGSYAILAASTFEGLACSIAFYGTIRYAQANELKPQSPLDAAQTLKCPLLGHYGEQDPLISRDDVDALRASLKQKPAEIYSYPGAGHAFHEDFRPEVYRPIAATEAWRRSIEYLQWYRAG